eukprot:TRINITY_DN939_c0_g2_i3.p1 TRINITY_DN939_c0_g2~~TRINITY_DN939_c0_g2_i3.p1  ORF type:complete len:284 (-),score=56.50 TRINITY_DN939_c0_g2_i3:48-851(-)
MEAQIQLFKKQLHYVTQACFQSHTSRARKEAQQPNKSLHQFASDLSMVTKVEGHVHLTNPYFCIEECVEQLALSTFLPSYENVAQYCPPPVLPKKIKKGPKLTLVLDLDETLVHASLKPVSEEDKQISVSNGTADVTVYISIRPWAMEFLKEAARCFEVVVFTAADKVYADKAIDLLDPDCTLVRHRLYRNSCMSFNPLLVKDINILGRDLSKTVIVDNNPSSFAFQNENAILIKSYKGDKNDTALLTLGKLLGLSLIHISEPTRPY